MNEIKKEIIINAPVTKVWEHLTNSAKIAGWFLPNDFKPVVGHQFTLDCKEDGRVTCVVREVVPPRKLVYTFKAAELAFDTLVTFTLEAMGTQTKLTLIHSGWEGLKPGEEDVLGRFEQGWGSKFLQQLKAVLDSAK